MLSHMDINIFDEVSDVQKFLIISIVFLVLLTLQHLYSKHKDAKNRQREDFRESIRTSFDDLNNHK